MSFRFPHKMFEKQTALFADFQDFEQKIQALAQQINLDLNQYEIDHLSLRVNTEQTANAWLTRLLAYGWVLSDNLINGRVIYLIQLHEPLRLAQQEVDVVEFLWNQPERFKVKTSEPKGCGETLLNLSVAVSFLDKTQNPTCIKFHPYSIKQIVSAV